MSDELNINFSQIMGRMNRDYKANNEGMTIKHVDVHTWVTADGRTIDIKEMSSDHIMNCIMMLQHQITCLENVEFSCKKIDSRITGMRDSIEIFITYLDEREV